MKISVVVLFKNLGTVLDVAFFVLPAMGSDICRLIDSGFQSERVPNVFAHKMICAARRQVPNMNIFSHWGDTSILPDNSVIAAVDYHARLIAAYHFIERIGVWVPPDHSLVWINVLLVASGLEVVQ